METAIFAGGCFWCMVQPFDSQPGIDSVVSGYTGGHTKIPLTKTSKRIRRVILKLSKLRLIPISLVTRN